MKNNIKIVNMVNIVRDYLLKMGLDYNIDENTGVINFGFSIPGCRLSYYNFRIMVKGFLIAIYGRYPLVVDVNNKDQMRRVSELLHRINNTILDGDFELSFDSGVINYKAIACGKTTASLEKAIISVMVSLERFTDSLVRMLVCDSIAAADAIEKCKTEENHISAIERILNGFNEKFADVEADTEKDADVTADDVCDYDDSDEDDEDWDDEDVASDDDSDEDDEDGFYGE